MKSFKGYFLCVTKRTNHLFASFLRSQTHTRLNWFCKIGLLYGPQQMDHSVVQGLFQKAKSYFFTLLARRHIQIGGIVCDELEATKSGPN